MKYFRRGGGYYIDVGCCDLIIDGKIPLLQWEGIERFMPEGARLRDGTIVPADLLVLATGYRGFRIWSENCWARTWPGGSARSGVSARTASCATCSVAPPSRASGSPPAAWR